MILLQFMVVVVAIVHSANGQSFNSEKRVQLKSTEDEKEINPDLAPHHRSKRGWGSILHEKEINPDLAPHHRSKRGWGSILLYGTAMTLRVGTAGLALGTIIQGGCNMYPSICTYRDAINKLNDDIKEMKKKYDAEYIKSAKTWVTLRDGNNNNGYINYYINEAKKGVTTLMDEQKAVTTKLFTKVPVLFKRFQASSKNISSEKYLQTLIGQEEVSLDDINAIIEAQKDNELMGLLLEVLVEASLDILTASFKKSFREIKASRDYGNNYGRVLTAAFLGDHRDAAILLDPSHPEHQAALKRHNLKSNDITLFDRLKMTPKVLKGMFENAGIWIGQAKSKAGTTFSEWRRIDSWDGLKNKLTVSLEAPKRGLRAMKSFIFDAHSRKYTVDNFKLDFSSRIMHSVGIIVDIIMTAVSAQEWAKVRDQIAEGRKKYQEYKNDLQGQLDKIAQEQKVMNEQWTNITTNFKELSKPFNDLINDVAKNRVFANVLGYAGLPVKPNNPLSKVDLTKLGRTNILQTQQVYIEFLKKFGNNLLAIKEEIHARDVLYKTVQTKTNKNDPVQEILDDVSQMFKVSSLSSLVKFGQGLKKKDIVCTTAVLQIEKDEYDYYRLPPFRPICNVSQAAFAIIEGDVTKRRNREILDKTVLLEARKPKSTLNSIMSAVKVAYSVQKSQELKSFGTFISKQDVACSVATQFPKMQTFDYVDLTPFRPSCSAVTKSKFDQMLADTNRLKELDTKIAGYLSSCSLFNNCVCIQNIAAVFKATEAEVKASMKRVKPKMAKYCSNMPCGCTTL